MIKANTKVYKFADGKVQIDQEASDLQNAKLDSLANNLKDLSENPTLISALAAQGKMFDFAEVERGIYALTGYKSSQPIVL